MKRITKLSMYREKGGAAVSVRRWTAAGRAEARPLSLSLVLRGVFRKLSDTAAWIARESLGGQTNAQGNPSENRYRGGLDAN